MNLFDVAPGPACGGDAKLLALGAADLRFHASRYEPRPFTGGRVRIDLSNLAHVLKQGRRLVAVVSFGDAAVYETFPHVAATLTVGEGSRLVIPRGS